MHYGLTDRVLDEVGESESCMYDSSPLSSESSPAGSLGLSTRSWGRPAGACRGLGAGFGLVTYSRGLETLGSRPTLQILIFQHAMLRVQQTY